MFLLINKIPREKIRFAFVGIAAVLSDLTVYNLSLHNNLSTGPAKSLGYFSGVAISYFGNNGYTFKKKKGVFLRYLSIYLFTWFLNSLINFGVLALLNGKTPIKVFLGWGFSTILSACSNFVLLSRLVFNRPLNLKV
jgi:putative flippase GtrA